MVKSVKLQVITPTKLFYEGDIELVITKTLSGEEGFMANHSWACKLLDVGELLIQELGSKGFKVAAISGGYIDVRDEIVIYTDVAEWDCDINKERALDEKKTVEDWLAEHRKDTNEDPENIQRAIISLSRQRTRLKVADGGRKKK